MVLEGSSHVFALELLGFEKGPPKNLPRKIKANFTEPPARFA
jgi:hypothetical protein